MRTFIVCLAGSLCFLFLSSGCRDAPKEETAARHAAASVVPGSYEDWCGEHAVPESQCTRCNPELIAAFRATGDWCQEHGLPESQCATCDPSLEIERPPKPEAP